MVKFKENQILKFEYKNYKGEVNVRTVLPKQIIFGKTPNCSNDHWILIAEDLEKQAERYFVIKHISKFFDEGYTNE